MRGPGTINRNGGLRVGIRLWVEVMDHSPAVLTWRERWVLAVLAEDANDETRTCYPSYDGDSAHSVVFARRTRCSRSQYYAVMQALVDKGVVKSLRRAQKYGSAKYLILPMAPVQRPVNRDPEPDSQRPGSQDPEESQGPGSQDTEGDSQGPGFEGSGSRFDGLRVPVSGSQGPGSQDPYPSIPSIPFSLSSPVEFVRAAKVVPPEHEREFADWIIRTRKPGSPAWWRKVIENGDIVVLAAAWNSTAGPATRRTVDEILTEHDQAPAQPETAPRAIYEPGDDKQARERARQALGELPAPLWEPLLAEAGRLLLADGYEPTWNSSRVLAAHLLDVRGEPISTLYLPADPDEAHRTAKFALDHLAEDRDAAFVEAATELRGTGLSDDRAFVIHAGEILTRWQYAPPPRREAEP